LYWTETWDWREWESDTRKGSQDYQSYTDHIAQLTSDRDEISWAIQDMAIHPLLTIKMILVRGVFSQIAIANSASPDKLKIGPLPGRFVYIVLHVLINIETIAMIVLAGIFLWKYGIWEHWPYWAPWVALLTFHSIVYAEPKYLFSGRPGIFSLAAMLLTRQKSSKRVAAALRRLNIVLPVFTSR
jgi:hypothetical protein